MEIRIDLANAIGRQPVADLESYGSHLAAFCADLEEKLQDGAPPGLTVVVNRESVSPQIDTGKAAFLLLGAVFVGITVGVAAMIDPEETKRFLAIIFDGLQRYFPRSNVTASAERGNMKVSGSARSMEELREVLSEASAILNQELAESPQMKLPPAPHDAVLVIDIRTEA